MPYSPNSPMPTDTISLAKWICEVLFLEPSQHQSFFESVLNHHYESLDDLDSQEFHDDMDGYMPGDRREWLAYFLASNLLADVTDKQSRPLIEHCLRIFHSCCHLSPDQRLAALLHDCVEDGQLSYYSKDGGSSKFGILDLIKKLFGDAVEGLVYSLSRVLPSRESYSEYIQRVAKSPDAIPIKLADLRDNLDPTRGPIPGSLRQRYEEAIKVLEASQAKLETEAILSSATERVNRRMDELEDSFTLNDELFQAAHPFSDVYIGDCQCDPSMGCGVPKKEETSLHLITEQEAALDSYSLSSLASIEPPYDPPDNYNLDLDLDLDYSAECDMVWDGDEFKEVG